VNHRSLIRVRQSALTFNTISSLLTVHRGAEIDQQAYGIETQGATTPSVDRLVLEYGREVVSHPARGSIVLFGWLLFIMNDTRLVGAGHVERALQMKHGDCDAFKGTWCMQGQSCCRRVSIKKRCAIYALSIPLQKLVSSLSVEWRPC
jgi:hypothetical protein